MLNRSITGVRIGFVGVAVVCYFGTLALCAMFPGLEQPGALGALETLVMAIGAAILGDTVRPSGQATSAFHPKTPPSPSAGAIAAAETADAARE